MVKSGINFGETFSANPNYAGICRLFFCWDNNLSLLLQHDHHHHDHHSHHLENDGFTSISFESDKPFSIRKFQHFLDNQLPSNVFRAKGILWFNESEKRHIFHLSGKRFSLEDEEWKGTPKNQLVFIGQNLDTDKLYQQVDNCLSLPTTSKGEEFG